MKEPLYPVKNQTGNERRIAFINSAGDIVFEIPGVVPLGILESRAFVHQKTHLLLIDDCGQPVAKLKADWAETFVNGYCIVKVKHTDPDPVRIGMFNQGLVDLDGRWVVQPEFADITNVYEGYYARRKKETDYYDLCELSGTITVPGLSIVGEIVSEGLVASGKPGDYGVLGYRRANDGEWVIEPQYDTARPFYRGVAAVIRLIGRKYKASFIDRTGKEIVSLPGVEGFRDGFSEDGVIGFYSPRQSGYLDVKGNVVLEGKFELLGDMIKGAAPVKTKGKWGLIGIDGKWRRKPEFESFNRQYGPFYSFRRTRHPLDQEIVLNPEGKTIWPRE